MKRPYIKLKSHLCSRIQAKASINNGREDCLQQEGHKHVDPKNEPVAFVIKVNRNLRP